MWTNYIYFDSTRPKKEPKKKTYFPIVGVFTVVCLSLRFGLFSVFLASLVWQIHIFYVREFSTFQHLMLTGYWFCRFEACSLHWKICVDKLVKLVEIDRSQLKWFFFFLEGWNGLKYVKMGWVKVGWSGLKWVEFFYMIGRSWLK